MIINLMKHKRKPSFKVKFYNMHFADNTTNTFNTGWNYFHDEDGNNLYTVTKDGEILEFDVSTCQWNYS